MTSITIPLTEQLKAKVEGCLEKLDITWVEFLERATEEVLNIPNAECIQRMEDIEAGKNLSKRYSSMAEIWAEIEAEDVDA